MCGIVAAVSRRNIVPVLIEGLRRLEDRGSESAGGAGAGAARTGACAGGGAPNEPRLRAGLANVRRPGPRGRVALAAGRAGQLPFADASFDAVTFSYLLRYVESPAATIAEMARCLRPGGTLASLEFHVPPQPVWHAAWWCYTRLALPVLGAITGGRPWYQVGRFLGPSISGHYRQHPLDAHVAAWHAAGLTDVGVELMSLGGGLIMWGRKEPSGSGGDRPAPGTRQDVGDATGPGPGS